MDGIPLCYMGYYDHNMSELQKARDYYLIHNDSEKVLFYENRIAEEREKLRKEECPTTFGRFIKKIIYKED